MFLGARSYSVYRNGRVAPDGVMGLSAARTRLDGLKPASYCDFFNSLSRPANGWYVDGAGASGSEGPA